MKIIKNERGIILDSAGIPVKVRRIIVDTGKQIQFKLFDERPLPAEYRNLPER